MTLVAMAGFDQPETVARAIAVPGEYSLVPPRPGARGSAFRVPAGSAVRARLHRTPAIAATDGIWAHYGFWMRNTVPGTAVTYLSVVAGANGNATTLTGLTSAGNLVAYRVNTSSVLGTGAATPGDGGWHHVSVSLRLSTVAGTGRVKVWVDGALDIDATAQTVALTSDRGLAFASLYSAGGAAVEFDDAWLDDDNNEWFAPKAITVATLAPDGPGASTQWTPEPAGQPNWTVAGDGRDDTYVSSQTAGHRDLYTFADLPAGATSVEGVSLYTRGQQVGAGTPLVKPVHRHTNGTVTVGTGIAQGASMGTNAPQVWATNPATSSAWTVADVNGAQFGMELA